MGVQGRTDYTNFALFLSGALLSRDAETILQDAARAAVLKTNTLMGRVLVAVPANGNGTAKVGNTGDGTVTALALAAGTLPRVGVWKLICTVATAHGGTFKLVDPGGNIVRNNLVMTAGAGLATVFYIPEVGLTFTITDGANDFIVTDEFSFAVTAVNKWAPLSAAAVNGAQIPRGIYAGDDITVAALVAGDVAGCPIHVGGVGATFDSSLLVIEGGSTLDTVLAGGSTIREALYGLGFYSETTIDISNLEN